MKAQLTNPKLKKNLKRGSTLLLTLLVTTALTLVLGSLLQWGVGEQKNNERHFLRLKLKNAVESIIEYGVADLRMRWENETIFPLNALAPSNNPINLPQSFFDFYADTEIQVDSSEITGGTVPPGQWHYIDPDNPANQFDSQKGKLTFIRNVKLYAKSSASVPKTNQTLTVYGEETLQVRDAPLFTHAVFYNMDLEFHPGPAMSMNGPVHANGNIWVAAVDSLKFNSTITTPLKYYHGFIRWPDDWSSGSEGSQQGTVSIKDADGNYMSDYKGSGNKSLSSSYYDSRYTVTVDGETRNAWRELASNRWDGNVQTDVHEVPYLNPIGFKNYIDDDPATPTVAGDDLNYAYALIEPNMPAKKPSDPSQPNPEHKGEGEKQKFAYKAGLIVRLIKEPDASKRPAHAQHLKGDYYIALYKLARDNAFNPYSEPTLNADGNVQEIAVTMDSDQFDDVFRMYEYQEDSSSNTPTESFWDARRGKGLDVLRFNVSQFRELVDNTRWNYNPLLWTSGYTPTVDYSGIVYFEFPRNTSITNRPDNVTVSQDNFGLLVINGSNIPNPSYNYGPGRSPGFTIATNNTLYIKGHFNADGDEATGSATEPDHANSPNPPVALAADAITILSNNWDFTKSKSSASNRTASSFNEVCAGIIAGLVPTAKGGAAISSGGNHNFPRFLENWSGKKFRYRGSMVCLYESEIANQGYSTSYYSPPQRDWGYYTRFKEGHYPPGTPMVRSFKKVDFKFITKAEYEAALGNLSIVFGN
ncbi:MAG: hypothetical protein COZ46_03240 [Verrucomicrobia bacterium CG_4_10_14_3_um_filter_43_23]|nr:MAG: hypothetical protein AUJ82_00665 [Verrucomicrobia bacterium CG1_02_43_26]PIP59216.1 MAG: hypothetical protein COX01_04270 [Verrucomicrobia bacterium CG22_combo_CG10-13_8_21_14_all_43_17]PIX58600.1 MAG: hypothetical protein COZ46_03240 [Verrucomicrobia bacterium CG_4_10_14_3_um_filter_43_23]PIY61052.1 MAG: hypothetical protein COY94_07560 [Verrucomicrobia bacterium CG_4_10_14_0_8_um_filter_43_34]PJA43893.1 MAG: hypothetical protein CO175_05930 [Verrucomicrobia bacterium CG_4_9_14_3_um_fi